MSPRNATDATAFVLAVVVKPRNNDTFGWNMMQCDAARSNVKRRARFARPEVGEHIALNAPLWKSTVVWAFHSRTLEALHSKIGFSLFCGPSVKTLGSMSM